MRKQIHYTCIEILDGIEYFEKQIETTTGSLNGIGRTFPELNKKYKHQIEIYRMCILRLEDRYQKQINKLSIPECFQG